MKAANKNKLNSLKEQVMLKVDQDSEQLENLQDKSSFGKVLD